MHSFRSLLITLGSCAVFATAACGGGLDAAHDGGAKSWRWFDLRVTDGSLDVVAHEIVFMLVHRMSPRVVSSWASR